MAKAYTPGLKVTNRIKHRVRRQLPIQGDVLVKVGDTVNAHDVVAQTFMPGDVTPLNLANMLALPPGDVPECMVKKEGDEVAVGDLIARTRGIFGMFKKEYRAKDAGTLETVSSTTGQIIMRGEPVPVQVKAYMCGTVVEILAGEGCIIEADASFIQGIFGIGGETGGPIRVVGDDHNQELTDDLITADFKGAILVGGARVTASAIKKAVSVGVAGIVTGGIDDQDLRDFLGYDLGVAITGREDVGLTLIITEGFGEISMARRTFDLLRSREGDEASINGATQIRAGVMRPEIIVPLSPSELAHEAESHLQEGLLEIGRTIRVIRDPYFGLIGEVSGLPHEPQVLESGSKSRVLDVKLDSGESVTVPRANVELIEG